MSARATRRAQAEPDFSALTNLDNLILAQAVYELGSNSWPAIAKLLSKHPLLSHPRSFFTAQSCQAMYSYILKEASLEMTDADTKRHAPLSLKLAQKYYQARLLELRDLIGFEEEKFRNITAEIEKIRKGAQDNEVKAHITGVVAPEVDVTNDKIAQENDYASAASRLSSTSSSGKIETPCSFHKDTTSPRLESPLPEVDPQLEERILQEDPVVPQGDSEAPTAAVEVEMQGNLIRPSEAEAAADNFENEGNSTSASASIPETSSSQVNEIGSLLEPEPEDEDAPLAQVGKQGQTGSEASVHEESVDAAEHVVEGDEKLTESTSFSQSQAPVAVVSEDALDVKAENNLEPARSHSGTPAATDIDMLEMTDKVASPAGPSEPLIDPLLLGEDEKSRSSQPPSRDLATPSENIAEAESERIDVMENEGPASGDELLHKTRISRRNRPSTTAPLQTRSAKIRRQSRASVPVSENDPELEEPEPEGEEEKGATPAQTPGVVDEPSPAPEVMPYKRGGKRPASSVDGIDTLRDKKRIRDDSEPAEDDEPGPASTTRARRRNENQASKRFQNVIGMLHSQISQHRNGTIFHNPIKDSEAPDYHEIVKRPMDLKTIKTKFRDGLITNSLEFQRDIFLMFANAMMYNRPGSDVYLMAEDMMLESEGYIQTFRQTEGFVRGSQR